MEKRKDTYKVEGRRSKAFIHFGANSGSAAEEEMPAASQLRKLDAMFASGTTADMTAVVADDPIARIAAIDAKFSGWDNAAAPGATLAAAVEGDDYQSLAAIDDKYAGFDNAVANEAQTRLGALDAKLAAWDDTEGGIRPTE